MGVERSIDITAEQRDTILTLLRRHLPGTSAWVYGSRATWTSRPQSDLDLVVFATPEKVRRVGYLRQAFEESDLPFRVDLLVWSDIPESFRQQIERNHVVLSTEYKSLAKWAQHPLSDLADIRLSSVDKKVVPGERNVRLCNYTDVYYNSFINSNIAFMEATASEREIEKCTLKCGDVIITKDSEKHDDIGVPALVREEMDNLVCGYHLAILRPQERAYGPYLYYALSTRDVQQQFHSYANGITRFGLRKADVGLVELPTPALHEQRAIAHVLGTLDDKIELNRRMNETLEAMARALFKSWFVDFDPVRAKLEGRDPGLPQPLADLFPDRLVESKIGEIPKGWKAGTLRDVAFLNTESWKPSRPPEAIRYVDLTSTKWGYIEHIESYTWNDAPSRARRVLRMGDTIVSTVRPGNGSFALIDEEGLTGSTGFAVLRPKEATTRELVWCAATSSESVDRLSLLADGGAYPAVPPGDVLSTPVAVARPEVRTAFSRLSGSFLDRMEEGKRESRDLAALRDALLPKLISGKIRLRDAEDIAGAAA